MYKIDLNMELLKIIPFAQYLGIKPKDKRSLTLELKPDVHNHIGTLHAAAQFTLAETQSGLFLLSLFPEHAEEMMPLLRSSNLKYKHPAETELTAIATVDEASKEKFEAQYLKKGRAVLTIQVELKDSAGITTMVSEFGWYVQKSACAM